MKRKLKDQKGAPLRAGTWYVIANILLKGFAFLVVPFFTRIATEAEYGTYVTFQTWLSLLTIIATASLYTSLNRAQFDFADTLDQYVSSISALGSCIAAVAYLLAIIFMKPLTAFSGLRPLYIHLMFIFLLVASGLENLQTRNRLAQKYKSFVALTMAITISSLLGSLTLVLFLHDKAAGLIVGRIVPMICVYAGVMVYVLLKGKTFFNKVYWKYSLSIAVPLVFHTLARNVLLSSDKVMIQFFSGPTQVAFYGIGITCSQLVALLVDSLNQAWAPWLLQKLHAGENETIKKNARYYFGALLLLAAGLLLLAPEVVWVLGGAPYADTKYLIPWVVLGLVFQLYYTFFVNIEIYQKKTLSIAVATMSAAVLNIVLNLLLIPRFGYIAAAFTTAIGQAFLLLVHFLNVRKTGLHKVYDNRWNMILVGLFLALVLAIYLLYQVLWLRLLLILVWAAVVLVIAYKIWRIYKKT